MAGSRCTITQDTVHGWQALRLRTDALAVTVLPGKGADIYELTDLATGIDPLFKAPWGLQPPGAPAREGSDGAPFLENYQGSWQELFPNTNAACEYAGTALPFHGEVATRAWDWSVESQGDELAVRFWIDCELLPLRLERLMRLRPGDRRLVLDERVTNNSAAPVPFSWGHHCVLGAPLLAAGAQLRVPAAKITTAPQWEEDTARLVPAQQESWPIARLRDGGLVDLSVVPGPEAGSHDDVYLGGLTAGWAELANPELRAGFRLDWDPAVFGWMISWQAYGGARAMPLTGSYALGMEPWTSNGNLAAAVAQDNARWLAGGATLETTVSASIFTW